MSKQKEPPHDVELANAIAGLPSDHLTSSNWTDLKVIGNMAFSKGCYITAIKYYTNAIQSGERNDISSLDAAALYSNRSASYVLCSMVSGPSMAVNDAKKVIEFRPAWYKGFTRLGDALYKMKKLEEAKSAYEKALDVLQQSTETDIPAKSQDIQTSIRLCSETHEAPRTAPSATEQQQQQSQSSKEPEKEWVFNSVEDVQKVMGEDNSGRTARKAHAASVEEADRDAAAEYKKSLMETFRKKGTTGLQKPDGVSGEYDKYCIQNFAKVDKASIPEDYSKGTDYIGKVFTNEALKGTVGGSWGSNDTGPKYKVSH
eukprot:PhF_6_TR13888/c0_g1_i2/m.22308/K09553/STIP1; stress-induced-phosphoprotein 1